jgi:cell division protein ZapA
MAQPIGRERAVSTLKVEIYDQVYHLRGGLDEDYVARLARYVDEKMRSLASSTRTVDSARAAVLASLNITDELFAARQRIAQLERDIAGRTQRCLDLVEQALSKPA